MKKLRPLILILFFYFLSNPLYAQDGQLTISTKINEDKSVNFIAKINTPGTYTVILNFKDLINASVNTPSIHKIKYDGHSFFTLKPTEKEQGIGYSYSTSYIRGELKPKFDKEFVYILPYTLGKKVTVGESNFVNAVYLGSTTPADWKSYRFYTSQSDTVTAIRKGIVVSIKDIYDMDESGKQIFTSQANEIIIEHNDGTLATFRGFRKGLFVKLGQTVFPGSALGLSSKNSGNGRFNISLILTYLQSVDFALKKDEKDLKSMYGFVTPYFFSQANGKQKLENNQTYSVEQSAEVLQKEMTKKEIKALAKP